ncbi:MAG: hypothetical protein ACRD68_16815, partial [Pyrinomonadaceae bacterium]
MKSRGRPARRTVSELIEDDQVPVSVRHWLERYVAEGDRALDKSFVAIDPATMDQARLIFDVLNANSQAGGRKEFSDEARNYVEEYLYR